MSLNSDVTDDLDDTVVDNEIVQGPDAVNANQVPVTITSAAAVKDEEPTELSEAALQQIAAGNISFKTVEDNVTKVTSLGEIESEILAADGVSSKDAEVVQEAFGSLITEDLPIGTYTSAPSKVNLSHVAKYMRSQIATEEASTLDKYDSFIKNGLADATKTVERLTNVYAPDILELANEVRKHIAANEGAYTTSKNAVVLFNTADGAEFLNLLTANLDGIPFADIPQLTSKANIYSNAVEGVFVAAKNKYLRALILGNQDGAVNERVFEPGWAAMYGTVAISMSNIAQFYLDEGVSDALDTIVKNATERLEYLKSLPKTTQAPEVTEGYGPVAVYVGSNGASIHEAFQYLNETAAMFLSLATLSKNVLVLTELYDSL